MGKTHSVHVILKVKQSELRISSEAALKTHRHSWSFLLKWAKDEKKSWREAKASVENGINETKTFRLRFHSLVLFHSLAKTSKSGFSFAELLFFYLLMKFFTNEEQSQEMIDNVLQFEWMCLRSWKTRFE